MTQKKPNQSSAAPKCGSVREFYALLRDLAYNSEADDRRREERFTRSVALTVQPLDADFQPDGESFCAVTRDVSRNGLGFINSEPFEHQYLRIAIPNHCESTIIGRVCYNLSVGVDGPLFLVGVQFIS